MAEGLPNIGHNEGGVQNGATALLKFFEARTARHVFGLPGSNSVPIFNGIPASSLQFVASMHEGAALAMADGYARIAGPTAVLLYMFPGVATALSNLYNAWRDETPLVIAASQIQTGSRWKHGSVGECDLVETVAPFTGFAREVANPAQLMDVLEAAYRSAIGPPGGPSFISLPEDCLTTPLPTPRFDTRKREKTAPADLKPVVDKLAAARRPVIIVGGQLRRSGGSKALEALADAFEIPVMFEPFWNDRLGISPGHRCCLGQVTEGSSLVGKADFVLALGCRVFNEVHPRHDPWFQPGAFVAHVNADPSKVEQIHGASWSCAADPAVVAAALLEGCRKAGLDGGLRAERAAALKAAADRRSRPRSGPFAGVAEALSNELEHGYIVDESVSANYPLIAALRSMRGERYVSNSGGSLGWGAAAACGVALASGEPVVSVLGDGAFFFGLQGLWPAVMLDLPVTFVVLDNEGFGSTRYFEQRYAATLGDDARAHYVGSDFKSTRPSITSVAQAFGIDAAELADGAALRRYLGDNRGRKGPRLARIPVHH